jgi:hypothetical protein
MLKLELKLVNSKIDLFHHNYTYSPYHSLKTTIIHPRYPPPPPYPSIQPQLTPPSNNVLPAPLLLTHPNANTNEYPNPPPLLRCYGTTHNHYFILNTNTSRDTGCDVGIDV